MTRNDLTAAITAGARRQRVEETITALYQNNDLNPELLQHLIAVYAAEEEAPRSVVENAVKK